MKTPLGNAYIQGKKEAIFYIEKFIESLCDGKTINGELKYWSEIAYQEYFEDKGYKFGPDRFLAAIKNAVIGEYYKDEFIKSLPTSEGKKV